MSDFDSVLKQKSNVEKAIASIKKKLAKGRLSVYKTEKLKSRLTNFYLELQKLNKMEEEMVKKNEVCLISAKEVGGEMNKKKKLKKSSTNCSLFDHTKVSYDVKLDVKKGEKLKIPF